MTPQRNAALTRGGFFLARLWVGAVLLLTAGYCLLAYIPFTYHQVVVGGLLPWLSAFARLHTYFYWSAFAVASWTLPWRNRRTSLASLLFVFAYGAIGIILLVRPLLVGLENNLQSLLWALLILTPLAWLGALDWIAQRGSFRWAKQESSEIPRLFRALLLTAVYAWLLSAVLVIVRYGAFNMAGLRWSHCVLVLAGSLLFHLLAFMVVFLAVNFTRAITGTVSQGPTVHALSYAATAAALLMLGLKLIVFASVSFSSSWSTVAAFAVAFSTVLFLSGTSARLYRSRDGEIESPLALLLLPAAFLRSLPRAAQAGILVAASAITAWMLISVSPIDWEHLIQKLLIAAIWAGGFSFFYLTTPAPTKRSANSLIVAAAAFVCLYVGFIALPPKWQLPVDKQALDEYANYDVSFTLARTMLSPPVAAVVDPDSFYAFLVRNTNIPRSVHNDPVEINLAGKLTQTPGPKPNIFIFVIDSLRRDYVSVYNPVVDFTPNIEAFARESIVAQKAFTRYTGTGLSEPSIWTGAMLLHKQYITPFYPMNSLQKLLDFEQYQQFIAQDEILSTILAPSKLVTDLDAGQPTMNLRMCRSLDNLQRELAQASPGGPIFAYTQPQDIHVSVINREERSVPPGESHPGFYAPYASRVKDIDRCFGVFIQFLKSRGLYDNTIIILTADHGDSLGEQGQWGHAYHVTPELVRIPLIIHLPRAMKELSFDPNAPAFLTDITPSLYYLLGHRPISRDDLFGRPLFTSPPDEAAAYLRGSYMVASSYGPVYGLVENSGHSLYVADAVEYKDHFYEWEGNKGVTSKPTTPEIHADRQEQIRKYVNEIAKFYNFADTGSH